MNRLSRRMIVKVFKKSPHKKRNSKPRKENPPTPSQRNRENHNRYEVLKDWGESSKVVDQQKDTANGRVPPKTISKPKRKSQGEPSDK